MAARIHRLLPAALLGASCTTLLGVEDAVLDESASTAASSSSATSGSSSTSAISAGAGTASTSTTGSASSSSGGGLGGEAPSSSTSGPGGGGAGGDTSTSSSGGGTSTTGSSGPGGAGGASASSGGGQGGQGGATSSSGSGGSGGCDLPALPACPGVQPNGFSLASDLTDHWDVLAPQASVTAADELQLRVVNGTSEARVQAKVSLDAPTSCGVWLRLVLPSTGATVASGLAIEAPDGSYSIVHLESEIRARDASGGFALVPWDPLETDHVRARFDEAGALWLDVSPDGACWTAVDGPFDVGPGPHAVQIFVERAGTSGNATSLFDDYCL